MLNLSKADRIKLVKTSKLFNLILSVILGNGLLGSLKL